jgi:hypothetical protein
VQAAFTKLGISPEELGQLSNVADLIDKIAERWGRLSQAGRAAEADRLGIRPILPLLNQGIEHIQEMKAEAIKLGLVVDDQTVSSMSRLARETKVASQIVDIQLKQAFLGLTPVLLELIRHIGTMARDLNFVLDSFKKVEDRSTESDVKLLKTLNDRRDYNVRVMGLPEDSKYVKAIDARIAEVSAAIEKRSGAEQAAEPRFEATGVAPDPGDGGKKAQAAAMAAAERLKKAGDELDAAQLRLVEAHIAAAKTGQEKLDLELAKFDAAAKKRRDDLDAEARLFQVSKGKSGLSSTERKRIGDIEDEALAIQRQGLIDKSRRERDEKLKELDLEQRLAVARAAGDTVLQQTIEDEQERTRLLKEFIEAGQSPDVAAMNAKFAMDARIGSREFHQQVENSKGPMDAFTGALQTGKEEQEAEIQRQREGFAKAFAGGLEQAMRPGGKGIDILKRGIASAAEKGFESVGGVLFDIFRKAMLESQIGGQVGGWLHTAGNFIFGGGHAGGGGMSSGYYYRAAEGGATELAMVGRSGSMFSHADTVQLLREAAGGGASGARTAGPPQHLHITSELRIPEGFVSNQDLARMFGAWHQQTISAAVDRVQDSLPGMQISYQTLRN